MITLFGCKGCKGLLALVQCDPGPMVDMLGSRDSLGCWRLQGCCFTRACAWHTTADAYMAAVIGHMLASYHLSRTGQASEAAGGCKGCCSKEPNDNSLGTIKGLMHPLAQGRCLKCCMVQRAAVLHLLLLLLQAAP